MLQNIEIKSKDKESAIERALKILEATPENIVKVVEKQKSSSFLGLFNKEGIYDIYIDKDQKEIPKKVEEKKSQEKIKDKVVKENKVEKNIEKTEEKVSKIDKKEKEAEIIAKISELLEKMGLDLKAEITERDGKYYTVNLFGTDNAIIIGKKGKTLTNFEYMVNSFIRDVKITIDVEGFKEKRNDTLRDLAKKMAEKALATNKVVKLNPMPPKERKIIHEVINQYTELDTYSEGVDPKRYIVLKRKK